MKRSLLVLPWPSLGKGDDSLEAFIGGAGVHTPEPPQARSSPPGTAERPGGCAKALPGV
jgi:hypothetical protein